MRYLISKIPIGLIYSRLLIGLLLVGLSYCHAPHYGPVAVTLLVIGVLTDVFDGIVARHLGVSTQRLRRLDSTVDQIFWLLVVLATYLACPGFFRENGWQLGTLLGLEALTYVVSFLKFKKEVATHSFAAKAWVLVSFAALVQVSLSCQSGWVFQLCFVVGVLSRLEIIGILLTLKSWANDVPTIYHAGRLRRGKEIKRHKLFHG
ncbi:MAG: CDP-alcohol phosphatidyltransferase family protein [Cytophagaceae bacterium]|nr:MAG: CDP-alcohol phosphatidyltransferase family protein [Cytophagaceae bacterium]